MRMFNSYLQSAEMILCFCNKMYSIFSKKLVVNVPGYFLKQLITFFFKKKLHLIVIKYI